MQLEEQKKDAMEKMQEKAKTAKERMRNIKKKIAVYSGKGGVGKTTMAVNLAVSLAKKGYKVGFLDADIDGPNASTLFGIKEKTKIVDGMIEPIEKYGVRVISMSFLLEDPDTAIMWRGPMLSKAVNDFLVLGNWGNLDYLVIDLPPGTSDVPITILQLLDIDGFVSVTTPQALAVSDMKRSVNMLKNMHANVFGTVETMCGPVFGCSHEDNLAHIPMKKEIVVASDEGTPIVLEDGEIAGIFDRIIDRIK